MGMDGKICVVTGANTGIGRETARGLAAAGATVVLACRNADKGEAARKDIATTTGRTDAVVLQLDLADRGSVRSFVSSFEERFERLDVLVNNAGLWTTARSATADGLETTFAVNHLGPFLLTRLLEARLVRGAPARVVNLSSALHRRAKMEWDDLQFERRKFNGPAAYAQSKLANVLFTRALARRLEAQRITVNAVHPGVVRTELARDYPRWLTAIFHLFLISPQSGARTSLHVATSEEGGRMTGGYFEKCRPVQPSRAALDDEAAERLWTLSERLLGL
jgi:NAD(P)-dependent dehydrogenase (short-subunit alcohol dehydrogenase family)